MRPMRHPRSRVSQERMRESRASFLSIRISIVRHMARETSTAGLILALAALLTATAHAAEPDCPQPAAAESPPPAPGAEAPAEPADDRVSIEADDDDFKFDVNGNAVLSGNVVMRQGNRTIRADRLEYDAGTGRAKLSG